MIGRHSDACDCPPCLRSYQQRTLWLSAIFTVLAIAGAVTVIVAAIRAGIFAGPDIAIRVRVHQLTGNGPLQPLRLELVIIPAKPEVDIEAGE